VERGERTAKPEIGDSVGPSPGRDGASLGQRHFVLGGPKDVSTGSRFRAKRGGPVLAPIAAGAMAPALIGRGTCAARLRPACLPEDAVERGERTAKPEIGEPIQHGEFGLCDPESANRPWRCIPPGRCR